MSNEKKWNKKEYDIFLKGLYNQGDTRYRKFHSGLGINRDYLIGIPVPQCKKIAQNISKTDYKSFIKYNKHNYYEEILIHGLVIGDITADFPTILKLLTTFITYIDNWALCDITVANLHIWKKHLDDGLPFIIDCLKENNEWHKRVGYVLLLDYYVDEKYLDIIFKLCNENQCDKYYVKMAIAWLISICYIKYPNTTLNYLKNNELDNWTHNKAIQKIRESKRIKQSDKENLSKLKRTSR